MKVIGLEDIREARQRIQSVVQKTQLGFSQSCSQIAGTDIYLKFENEQKTGSFKIRGAYNKISSLSDADKSKGIIASSAGNHAQGVAFSASRLGVKSRIVMPMFAPHVKVGATKAYGAEVILHGQIYDDAYDYARQLEREKGYIFVPPYEDPLIIAGQGTIGLEILEDLPDVDSVVVPIGGGGLMSGVAVAIKALRPQCKVYGVQAERVPTLFQMFHKMPISPVDAKIRNSTIADGIAVKKASSYILDQYLRRYVDDIVTVTEDEIAQAIVFLLERAKTVVEGSGAVVWSAVAKNKLSLGKKSVLILSGGNIDLNLISKIIERGLMRKGRLARLSVVVDDMPGNLNRLTSVLAEKRANILEVSHDRLGYGIDLRETRIDFLVETESDEQIVEIRNSVLALGARLLE